MNKRILSIILSISAGAQALVAQPGAQSAGGAEYAFDISHVWIGDADLDGGGELGTHRTALAAGVEWPRGRGESIGVSLGAARQDYDFSGPVAAGLAGAWSEVAEYSIGASWRRPVGDSDILFVAPSLRFARANGADWGDSASIGAIASYGRRISDTLTLGIGAGVFHGLEETSFFPVLLIDWRIDDQWRVGNSFRPGPAGPAGLEIAYQAAPGWEIALGAGWRSNRFRLDQNGPNPDGIGELQGFPAFLRVSWDASETLSLNLYGGLFLAGEVTAEDHRGHQLASDDLSSSPLAAISLSAGW